MRIYLYLILFIFPSIIYASNPYMEDIEPAILEVIYSRKQVTDTTSRNNHYIVDDVLLRIGREKSVFCGVLKLWEDSISKVDYPSYSKILKISYEKDPKNFFFLGGKYWSYIYKNKKLHEITECDYFNLTHWKYQESLESPEWIITDSIKNCLGFDCIMATTNYKGRDWVVWYTPEILISDGPWKLWGLPGLILEAYDVNHDYEFIPQAINSNGIGEVGYMWYIPENDHRKVSREQFLKEWRKNKLQNNAAKIKAAYNMKSDAPKQTTLKLLYDREEIDYPH